MAEITAKVVSGDQAYDAGFDAPLTQTTTGKLRVDASIVAGAGGDASAANQVITNTELGATNEGVAATTTTTSGINGVIRGMWSGLVAVIGANNVAAAASPSATATLNALLKGYWAAFNSLAGALTETSPATDTASSGVNGRLQRIAQNITLLIAQMGDIINASGKQSFTRPGDTTAYAVGDLIANSTTAGSVAALAFTGVTISGSAGEGIITDMILNKSTSGVAQVRAHLLRTNHAVTNGDNGAIVLTSLDLDNYIGWADVSMVDGVSGGALGHASNLAIYYQVTSGDTIYMLLEALTAYTPGASEVFTVKLKQARYS